MAKFQRVFVIVLDSLGVGRMADSDSFGDYDVDTLGHIAAKADHLVIPNLQRWGIANLHSLQGISPAECPLGYYAKLNERSAGKDTMTGHWEMMGLHTTKPFITFTDTGFPKELLDELSRRTGHKIIGNKAASGTEILDELGEEEIATGNMIVYTSADSVLQICGNEETFGLEELYRCCEIARELTMKDEWKVGRVIARPYVGRKKGEFVRTPNRHDYAVKPFGPTALNALKDAGLDVISVGKINDIFVGEGITEAYKSRSSVHGMKQTVGIAQKDFNGLCFVNLVEFDSAYGHRRDIAGYTAALNAFDAQLGALLPQLRDDDLLILTADHGCDPAAHGTDHTREYIPVLMYGNGVKPVDLGIRSSFADIGQTVCAWLSVDASGLAGEAADILR